MERGTEGRCGVGGIEDGEIGEKIGLTPNPNPRGKEISERTQRELGEDPKSTQNLMSLFSAIS